MDRNQGAVKGSKRYAFRAANPRPAYWPPRVVGHPQGVFDGLGEGRGSGGLRGVSGVGHAEQEKMWDKASCIAN